MYQFSLPDVIGKTSRFTRSIAGLALLTFTRIGAAQDQIVPTIVGIDYNFWIMSIGAAALALTLLLITRLHLLNRELQKAAVERATALHDMATLERRSRNLLENAPYPLLISELDSGEIMMANPLAMEMLRIDPVGVESRPAVEYWQDPEKYEALMQWLRYTGFVATYEARLKSGPDSFFWASLSTSVIELDGRQAVLTAISDISHLKEIAANLRRNQSRFQIMADAVPAAVIHISEDGSFIFANRTAREWFGIGMGTAAGSTYKALDRFKVFRDVDKLMPQIQHGQSIQTSQDELLQDGDRRHLDASYIPVMADEKTLDSWLMLITDVTRWKDMELRLQELARTDELTDLHNRRYLYETGETEIVRARRFGREFSLLLIDVDHFKMINDQLGHAAGDNALRALGNILRNNCRATDVVARTGGEEFVILLPETALADAAHYAEKLRKEIQAASIVTARTVMRITVSIGVATLTERSNSLDSILSAADKALYRAKSMGRNCVELWDDDNTTVITPIG